VKQDVEEEIDFIDLCGGEKQVRTTNKKRKQIEMLKI